MPQLIYPVIRSQQGYREWLFEVRAEEAAEQAAIAKAKEVRLRFTMPESKTTTNLLSPRHSPIVGR